MSSLIGVALVLTLSRGAMLGLLCVALVVGALRYRRILVLAVVVVSRTRGAIVRRVLAARE